MPTARDRPPEEAAEDTSFARGLRLLLTIADRGEMRADELSALLETPLSTVYRYLRTLTEFGFVERRDAGYVLGPRLLIGTTAVVSGEALIRAAGPTLGRLVEETGETAVISRRVGLSAVCLHEIESPHPLRVSLEPGVATPLYAGALAKVLLAYAPPDILDEVLGAGLPSAGPGSQDEAMLRAELSEIVTAGIARSDGEPISGVVTMAVPILREDGIVAAVGVVGPTSRCTLAWRARVARLLPEAAHTILGSIHDGSWP
jgi:DNA-binding IclR family transcriptional regulator